MKVILFANTDWYLYNFRRDLALALRGQGHQVVLVSPGGEYVARLQAMGLRWLSFDLSRRGMNPFKELAAIIRLTRLYHRERPDITHHFTIKPVLYGSLAAQFTGIAAVVNSITGLGYIFVPSGNLKRLFKWFVQLFYRIVMRRTQVIFENAEDRDTFLHQGIVIPEKAHLIAGVGIDTERFKPATTSGDPPVALLASRMLWDKGVGEFVEAARLIRTRGVPARFALAGRNDPGNPSSIPEAQLEAWREEKAIEWWGWQEDMPAVLAKADIVCLPSYYREGVPTILIEAAACGRPLVATDMPGCRDIVQDGVNGILVPVRDSSALARALRTLLESPSLRQNMGARGRQITEQRFSSKAVLAETLAVYNLASGRRV